MKKNDLWLAVIVMWLVTSKKFGSKPIIVTIKEPLRTSQLGSLPAQESLLELKPTLKCCLGFVETRSTRPRQMFSPPGKERYCVASLDWMEHRESLASLWSQLFSNWVDREVSKMLASSKYNPYFIHTCTLDTSNTTTFVSMVLRRILQ